MADPYPGYLTPEQQQAQASQSVHTAYDPLLELYRKQQDRQRMSSMAEQAGLARLYDLLGGSLAGFSGQISDAYNQAGNAIMSPHFQSGYSKGWDIVQQGFQGQAAGYGQSAAALPAISGQEGGVKFLTAYQQGQEADQKLQDLIDSTAAEMPGKIQDFLASLQKDQADLSNAYTSNQIKAATLQEKEAADAYKWGQSERAFAWSIADRYTKSSDHFYIAKQTKNGWQVVDAGPKAQKQVQPKAFQHVVVNGKSYTFNPNTGKFIDPATGRVVAPKTAAKLPKIAVDASRNLGKWVDSFGNPIPGLENTPVPPLYKPTKPAAKKAPPLAKPTTRAQLNAGFKILNDSYLHAPGSRKRLSKSQPDLIHIFNVNKDVLVPQGITTWQALRDALPHFTQQNLQDLGIMGMVRNPQEVYLDMVHAGVKPRKAWQLVRGYFPNFGPDYFK